MSDLLNRFFAERARKSRRSTEHKIETKDNVDRNSASVIARKQTLTMPRQCATSVIARQSPKAMPKQSQNARLLRHRLACFLAMTMQWQLPCHQIANALTYLISHPIQHPINDDRSEERRVGKEWR